MSALEIPDNALSSADNESNSVREEHLTLLWAIALWYNGIGIKRGTNVYHIGITPPPSLKTLIGCSTDEWDESYKSAFADIKEAEMVSEKTLLRRKVPWAPTKRGLKMISNVFGESLKQIVIPHSAFNKKKGHIGDWNELLAHRTAVEQMIAWLWDAGYDWEMYPGKAGHERPDARGFTGLPNPNPMMISNIEVISNHNDKEMCIRKYGMFTEDPKRTSLWIFENREAAGDVINWLSETRLSGYTDKSLYCSIANTPLRGTQNYSIQTLNDYLQKSQESGQYTCTGIDYVQTITGIHERRDSDAVRKPIAIWNTNTDEIELHTQVGTIESITLEDLNSGASLRASD